MSKKTKREKIITDLRRKLAQQTVSEKPIQTRINIQPQPQIKPKEANVYNWEDKKKKDPASNFQTPALTYDSSYIKKDLYKTVFVTLFILALEFVLYFVLEKRIINWF